MEKIFSVKEVAARYGVAVKTVYYWVSHGRLKAIRVSPYAALRFSEGDLKAMEKRGKGTRETL